MRPAIMCLGACVLVAGCVGPPGATPSPAGCPAVTYDGEIPVPATSTMVPIDTRASAHTTDPAGSVQVSIDDNRGTVSFGGSPSLPAFIYRRIPWPDVGFTLLAGLAVDEGAGVWLPFWVYCTSDGVLGRFYAERTDNPDTVHPTPRRSTER